MNDEINNCVLKLEHLLFDELHFERCGFQNENPVHYRFGYNFEMRGTAELIAHILIEGKKDDEYNVTVRASGYFILNEESHYDRLMLRQNASAIVFPYMRSQLSLLTSQPEVEPLVLQPFNIAQMVKESLEQEEQK